MDRILVVSFSRTGNTDRIASELAIALGADRDPIVEPASRRRGILGFLRSGREAWSRKPAIIGPPAKDPATYDLVVLGSPVWVGSVASPMRAYLNAQGAKLPRVAFFCTLGGSGDSNALAEMARLCGKPAIAVLSVTERELRAGTYRGKLTAFVAALRPLRTAA